MFRGGPLRSELRVRTFVAVLLTAAAGVLAGTAVSTELPPPSEWIWATLVFGLLFAVAEYYPVPLAGRGGESSFTMSAVPGFTLLLMVPLPVALGTICTAVWVVNLAPPRLPTIRAGFNAAVSTLSFALGALILVVLVDLPAAEIGLPTVGAVLLAGVATLMLTSLLTITVIALDQGIAVRHVLRDSLDLSEFTTHQLLPALAPMLVVSWHHERSLVPVVVLVMFGVYRGTREGLAARTQARNDPVTGLPNRLALDERVSQLLRHIDEDDTLSLLMVDLDQFGVISDRLGQEFGNRLLRRVGRRLDAAPDTDTVAHLGGDTFAVLVRRCDGDRVRTVAANLLDAIAEPHVIDGVPVQVGASVGAASAPADGTDAAALLRVADAALATAKRLGSAPHVQLSGGHTARRQPGRLSVLGEFEAALADGQLRLDYQPQIDAVDATVVGLEALLRWQHPQHGEIAPDVFIGALEHTDLMPILTRFVTDRAVTDLADFRRQGYLGTVSVNVSARDLRNRRLADEVADVLGRHGMPGDRLTIEVTESALVTDQRRAHHVMNELAELRVGRSLDDFGTGYSSLSALATIPLSEIKIDRAFVLGLRHGAAATSILRAIVDLAARLELTSVAEGVETPGERQVLRRLGCQVLQGYLVARPMSLDAVPSWLLAHGSSVSEAAG